MFLQRRAHTGGGGGNFGIVTRYWLRSPGALGTDPTLLLPKAPEQMVTFKAEWDWKQLDQSAFTTLVRNYGDWCERNSRADLLSAQLFSVLSLGRPSHGSITLRGVVTAGRASELLFEEHLAAIRCRSSCPSRQSKAV